MKTYSFPVPPLSDRTVAAFWTRVNKTDTCWYWTGGKRTHDGYGVFVVPVDTPYGRARLSVAAHKLSYVLCVGMIPTGKLLRHSCDTPPCVRPDHLSPGDHKDNAADAISRNRFMARHRLLSPETVVEFRRLYFESHMTVGAIAKRYGVSKPGIIAALIGATHKHVGGPTGPIRKTVGVTVFGAKMNESKVAELRSRSMRGETIYELGSAFGISPGTVSNIIRNKTWRHVATTPSSHVRRGHRKLVKEQVTTIRQRYARGVSQARLASDYSVSRATISMIVRRVTHQAG